MIQGVDEVLFTYVILSLFTLQAITFEISRVHTIDFMKEEIELKEYLMLRSFIVSGAIIGGSVITSYSIHYTKLYDINSLQNLHNV